MRYEQLDLNQDEFIIVTTCLTIIAGALGHGAIDKKLLRHLRRDTKPQDIRSLSDKLDAMWHRFGLPLPERR